MPQRRSGTVRLKKHVERITSKKHVYTVKVGGTRDPENHSIVIGNAGMTYVDRPRVRVNGQCDFYDTKTIIEHTLKGLRTDEEKAIALCYLFGDGRRFQRGNPDRSAVHPTVLFGVYGYNICGHTAACFDALCAAAGIRSRYWEINHHTVTEVYFDGSWHMLDGNVPVFYLKRDNRTIASMRDLEKDPDLVGRTSVLGSRSMESHQPFYVTKEYHRHYPTHSAFATEERDLGYVLRPFERFERYWFPTWKYHNQANDPRMPKTFANGKFIFEPDFRKSDVHDWTRKEYCYARNLKWTPKGSPVLRVDKPQDNTYDQPARLSFDVRSPYVIVGGKAYLKLHRSGEGKRDLIGVTARPYQPIRRGKALYATMQTGDFEAHLDLTHGIQPWGSMANNFYEFVIQLGADSETKDACTGISELGMEHDVQVAPKALPALLHGENRVVYTDESKRGREVLVTHMWRERADGEPPQAPVKPAPTGKEKMDTLAPTLEWKQPMEARPTAALQRPLRDDRL